jgi:hypothetical protein
MRRLLWVLWVVSWAASVKSPYFETVHLSKEFDTKAQAEEFIFGCIEDKLVICTDWVLEEVYE